MQKTYHPDYARCIADAICYDMKDYTGCIEIVGGLRRKQDKVLGISIIYISKIQTIEMEMEQQGNLFNGFRSKHVRKIQLFKPALEKLDYLRFRDTNKQLTTSVEHLIDIPTQVPIDIYQVTSISEWGAALALKTGPVKFCQVMLETAQRKGIKIDNHKTIAINDNAIISTPTEQDFFSACGVDWIEPDKRE